MDNGYLNEENDRLLSYDCLQFFAEEKIEDERDTLIELFPGILSLRHSDTDTHLFGDLELGYALQGNQLDNQVLAFFPKQEPKKRGRPPKKKACLAEPSRKCVPSTGKRKWTKCMTPVEKDEHNHQERERRKDMTMLVDRLRELVPAVSYDKKASQKKIVDEAASFLKEVKPDFLSYLKERQRFLHLETLRRDLERELASRPKGVLFVWEERQGMSASDLYRKVQEDAREDIRDEEIDEAIRLLESSPQKSPASSPDHSDSSEDSEDEEHINVEV